MKGKPNPGTKKDMRLKENKRPSTQKPKMPRKAGKK
jgi:hypothetical protein